MKPALPSSEGAPDSTARSYGILVGVAALVALAAYLPSLTGDFFSDDYVYIVRNDLLRGIQVSQLHRLLLERTNPWEYAPVRDLSLWLDIDAFGDRAAGYHVHNVLLYALCAGAVWLCAAELLRCFEALGGRKYHGFAAVGATLLFLCHPAHVESVAWISGRKDLLSGLFGFVSVALFLKGTARARPSPALLVLSYLAFTLSLMSKSTSVALAVVVVVLAALRWRYDPEAHKATALLTAAPFVVLAVVWTLSAMITGATSGIRDAYFSEVSTQNGPLANACLVLGGMTRIALWPVGLRLIYADVETWGWLLRAVGAGCAVGALIGLWATFRRSVEGFGVAFFAVLCIPFLQLIPYRTWSLYSDRFLFMPLFGLAIVAACLLHRFLARRTAFAVTVVLTGLGAGLTYSQASLWGESERLLEHGARLEPRSSGVQQLFIEYVLLPRRSFAEALDAARGVKEPVGREILTRVVRAVQALDAGDLAAADQRLEGLDHLVGETGSAELLLLLGGFHERRERYFDAIRRYHQAVKEAEGRDVLDRAQQALHRVRKRFQPDLQRYITEARQRPRHIPALGQLANLQMELYMLSEAEDNFLRILDLDPNMPAAHHNLALTRWRQNRLDEAASHLTRAIHLGLAGVDSWNNLGTIHKLRGAFELSREAFEAALRLDPESCFPTFNLARLHLAEHDGGRSAEMFALAKRRCPPAVAEVAESYRTAAEQL